MFFRIVCVKGSLDFVKELVKNGVDVNIDGGLIDVCFMGYVYILKELLNFGVDVNYKFMDRIFLIVVCVGRDLGIVKELRWG